MVMLSSAVDRSTLRRIQTPQGFSYSVLNAIHQGAQDATDDSTLALNAGHKVRVIAGEERALKITTPSDLATALTFLGDATTFSTGVGVDAHAFGEGRELWLAGLHWPDEVGVDGHSDGDVAAHAICDALFAATGLGDLGSNFGTSRPEYAGASGVTLLKETLAIITKGGYSIHMYLCRSSAIVRVLVLVEPKLSQRFRRHLVGQKSQSLQQRPMEWALPVKARALQRLHLR